ncbi:response regulator [Leptobacterium flavescens]|uniref:Response regulator n=1 Tax=Leptobacterium flavescens TaxID=472055 RepID=A0A6P0USR8_9FLAO|nr:LytTR family DNA-binding domain-containing protein [Leptobacterium flavescens]NER15028.1 response regulator [Leptobacterium flavescens]
MIYCLILEDEISAQEVLQTYIEKTAFISCIGVYESGLDIPYELLRKADILFLDIQLPELSGLSYLKTIARPPKVIVTTAYSDYAVPAFEENVLDYLVKPFSYERFLKAIGRARDMLRMEGKQPEERLLLYADKAVHKISTNDILYLKAEVDYVKVVTPEKSILILDSLRNWEEKLSDLNFVRIHRSYIINTDKIDKISGNQVFISDEALPVGKVYKNKFLKHIKYPY